MSMVVVGAYGFNYNESMLGVIFDSVAEVVPDAPRVVSFANR